MKPKVNRGAIFLPLLLILSASGLFLIKNIATKSFAESQTKVEANFQDIYNPFSYKYVAPLSTYIGKIDSWETYVSKDYSYELKHPGVWHKVKKPTPIGAQDYYEAALSDKVSYSTTVQDTFVVNKDTPKIKAKNGDFYFYQNELKSKAAVGKKNGYYYIVRFNEDGYFKDEVEFKGTFYQLLKNFEFLD